MKKIDAALIAVLTAVYFGLLPFFFLHQGLLLIDTGREFYLPQQMLASSVLYKDIFNIYAPLSYQLNALLFALFGQSINVLASAGVFVSFVVLITLYLLSREFLNRFISFLFVLFVMSALVFKPFLYHTHLSYCFAIVYALCFFLLSLLFLIKYEKTNKPAFIYAACFFSGLSAACKYEFIFYNAVIIYALRGESVKNIVKAAASFAAAPLASLSALFIQGLNFYDIKLSIEYIYKLVSAPLIKKFFLNNSLSVIQNPISVLFAFLPAFNIFAAVVKSKLIAADKPLLILVLSAAASSFKSLFCLNINHMGVFLLPVCFLAFIALINLKFKKIIPLILSILIIIFSIQDFAALKNKSFLLETPKGSIYTYPKEGRIIQYASDYIAMDSKPHDRVLVLPEGNIINFITDRKTNNFYYNLSPLFYYDVFGENNIIENISANPPEYIIILPIDNIEYGFRFFGADYAQKFYKFITDNYRLKSEKYNVKIFKLKSSAGD